MAYYKKHSTFNMAIFGIGLAIAIASTIGTAQATGYTGFSNPTKGIEIGLQRQVETISPDNEKVVQRTFARVQRTYDWQIYKNNKGNTFDIEAKGGLIAGQYKGSRKISEGYGSLTKFRGGAIAGASGIYTINTSKIDSFLGFSADYEFQDRPRSEYQADAVAGVKFNVSDDKDLSLRYNHTLAHGMYYHEENESIRQNDGYAVALIGTKRMTNKTSHTIKLEYEFFEKGKATDFGYEPDTDNWLLAYKRTF